MTLKRERRKGKDLTAPLTFVLSCKGRGVREKDFLPIDGGG
jgi:hypothetical protein